MSYDRRDPNKAFEQAMADAKRLVVELEVELVRLAQRQKKKPADWGYSGSVGHVVEGLENLVKFLKG
jgi:hypothetical protein